MRLRSRLPFASHLALATILLGCSSGGGGGTAELQAADLDGTWLVTSERVTSTCLGVLGEREHSTLTITLSGTAVRIQQAGEVAAEFVRLGDRVLGTLVDETSDLRTTRRIQFGLVGGKLEGTLESVAETTVTGQESCRETFRLTGERLQLPPAENFGGTWDLMLTATAVSDPGACAIDVGVVYTVEATIVVDGTGATLTPVGQAAIPLDVVGRRLQGTLTQDIGAALWTTRFDLGLLTNDTLDGTVTSTITDAAGATIVCAERFRVAGMRVPL